MNISKITTDGMLEVDEIKNMIIEKEYGDVDNIIVKKMVIENIDDATEYLEDIAIDNKKVYAVRSKEQMSTFDEAEESVPFIEDLKKYQELIDGVPSQLLLKLEEQTSSKKTCKICKSVIAKDFFIKKIKNKEDHIPNNEDVSCPICDDSDFLISATEQKQINGWKSKMDVATEKYNIAKSKFENNDDNMKHCVLIIKEDHQEAQEVN